MTDRPSDGALPRLLAAAALVAAAPSAGHAATPAPSATVAGGQLDPAHPDGDIYLADPVPAEFPQGRACAVAKRYVELVNAGKYAEVAALYADDAAFLEPFRPSLFGSKQIDDFYSRRIGGMQPEIAAVSAYGDDTHCLIELAVKREVEGKDRFILISVDHFILDESGKIRTMVAFARPPSPYMTKLAD